MSFWAGGVKNKLKEQVAPPEPVAPPPPNPPPTNEGAGSIRDTGANGNMSRTAADVAAAKAAAEVIRSTVKAPLERFHSTIASAFAREIEPLVNALAKEFAEGGSPAELPNELKVWHVAEMLNELWCGLRAECSRITLKNEALARAVGEETLSEMRIISKVAIASGAHVTSDVKWTPPAAEDAVKAAAKTMFAAQGQVVAALKNKDEGTAKAASDDLLGTVKGSLMPHYKRRVEALTVDEKRTELYVTMPGLINDLVPKARRVLLDLAPDPSCCVVSTHELLRVVSTRERVSTVRESVQRRGERHRAQRGRLRGLQHSRGVRVQRHQGQTKAAGDVALRSVRALSRGAANL